MKRPRYIAPEEVEIYETKQDKVVLLITLLAVIISIGLIIWKPDVEAIGNWIWTTFM